MSLDGFALFLLESVSTVVCVSDEAQWGVKPSDGVSLVVLPELFSTWGRM